MGYLSRILCFVMQCHQYRFRPTFLALCLTAAFIGIFASPPPSLAQSCDICVGDPCCGDYCCQNPDDACCDDPAGCSCNPDEEADCINQGGEWDPYSCECNFSCDPAQESACYEIGGNWDTLTCTCNVEASCNPGPPIEVEESPVDYPYCDGTYEWDCTGVLITYDQYCEDGSLNAEWTDFVDEGCSVSGYCGGGGGGGGGSGGGCGSPDCYYDYFCWCSCYPYDYDCSIY